MIGEQVERRRIAVTDGCVDWDDKQRICTHDGVDCSCLRDARDFLKSVVSKTIRQAMRRPHMSASRGAFDA